MTDYGVVFMTASNQGEAEKIAENLLSNKLAACVNIFPSIKSFYLWEGKLCKDNEILMVVKIKNSDFKELKIAVRDLHSYDVPEIILLSIEEGETTYLEWIKKVTK